MLVNSKGKKMPKDLLVIKFGFKFDDEEWKTITSDTVLETHDLHTFVATDHCIQQIKIGKLTVRYRKAFLSTDLPIIYVSSSSRQIEEGLDTVLKHINGVSHEC